MDSAKTYFLDIEIYIEISLNYKVLLIDKEKYRSLVEKTINDLDLEASIEHNYLVASKNVKNFNTLIHTLVYAINSFRDFFDEEYIETEIFIKSPSLDDTVIIEKEDDLSVNKVNKIIQELLEKRDKVFIDLGLLTLIGGRILGTLNTYPILVASITITKVDLF